MSGPLDRPYIVLDPAQNFGQPAIGSTRVKVADILGWLDAGESVATIEEEYGASREDVLVACWFEARYGTGAHPRDEWLDWLEEWEPTLWSAKGYDMIPLPPFKHWPDPSIARGRHL